MKQVLSVIWASVLLAGCGTDSQGSENSNDRDSVNSCDDCVSAFMRDMSQGASDWEQRYQAQAAIVFARPDAQAVDNHVTELVFPAQATALVGTDFATEIAYPERSFYGRYQARVQFSHCQANEEVVNGIFTYANDGVDLNQNGLTDNSEIDIEFLCGEPQYLWLSSWTDYDDNGFYKVTRRIDLTTGELYQTPEQGESQYDLEAAGSLQNWQPIALSSGQFYTVGFDWQADSIRWFIERDDQEVTLWHFSDARFIPQQPGQFMLNLWYPGTHWSDGRAADAAADKSYFVIDQIRYEPQ